MPKCTLATMFKRIISIMLCMVTTSMQNALTSRARGAVKASSLAVFAHVTPLQRKIANCNPQSDFSKVKYPRRQYFAAGGIL